MQTPTPATEGLAQEACKRQDFEAAATAVIEAYGTELYSFLLSQFHGHVSPAEDVFSDFTEDFWRALPKFEWRCSVRAWCYRLARSAASRHRRSGHNRSARRVPLSAAPWLEEAVQRARTSTQPHLRSEVKDEFQKLREKLAREEQDLLILRVDRNLSWRDVAHAMMTDESTPDDDQLRKAEAALRQRFADIKKRLKRLATEAGLL